MHPSQAASSQVLQDQGLSPIFPLQLNYCGILGLSDNIIDTHFRDYLGPGNPLGAGDTVLTELKSSGRPNGEL